MADISTITVASGTYRLKDTTARQQIVELSNYVTLEMYGAVGDGITEDTSAFNKALSSGKDILLLGKTYNIGSISITQDNLKIIGTEGSVLLADITLNAYGVSFIDFTIEAKSSVCLKMNYTKYATKYDNNNYFNNIIFKGINNCITISSNDRQNKFVACEFYNAISIAVDGMNSTDNHFLQCQIYTSGNGFRLGNNNFILDCALYNFTGTAIQLFGNRNSVKCDIQNSVNGIYVNQGNSGNTIEATFNKNPDYTGSSASAITCEGNYNFITALCSTTIDTLLVSGLNHLTGNIINLYGQGNVNINSTAYQNNNITVNGVWKRQLKKVGQIISNQSATDVLDYDFMVLIIDYTSGVHSTHAMRRRGSTEFTFYDGVNANCKINFPAIGSPPYFVSGSPCTITFYAYA